MQYAERIKTILAGLARSFSPATANVILAHLLAHDAVVGSGGGERELHMAMGVYGVRREALPVAAQYIALGHVHKPQDVACASRAAYSGSLLQLDFGEREQEKFVNLVEVHPGLPVGTGFARLPITAGRQMVDIGSPMRGVPLKELARYREQNDRSWFRVYVDLDMPVANLAQLVRGELPSAVHVERARSLEAIQSHEEDRQGLGPIELFESFYASANGRGRAPAQETMTLFRRLLDEERDETAAT